EAGVEAFTIVSAQSSASYFADEKLASLPTGSTAEGRTTIEGVFYLTPEGLAAAQATVFTVDLAGLESSESRRDTRVRGALQTSQFPVATFTASSLDGFPGEFPADGTEITMHLTGILDLRGVQREVTWEVQARRDGDIISAIATINFLYADFNIPVPNIAGFVSVEDDVTLQANIIATRS
ncbi:MAG: YceI family protein, partial [Dehalococcoidia bacterium]